eukprot:COSAG02_NODE_13452_length_1393_cov_1.334621_2_plen_101_part_00
MAVPVRRAFPRLFLWGSVHGARPACVALGGGWRGGAARAGRRARQARPRDDEVTFQRGWDEVGTRLTGSESIILVFKAREYEAATLRLPFYSECAFAPEH